MLKSSILERLNKEKKVLILLIVYLSFLSVAYSILSIIRHIHFESGAFDLGIFDQAIWLYSNFDLPISTIKEKNLLGDHLNLTLPFFSPLFYIWNDVKILLIVQAVLASFSAVPVFLIARYRKLSLFSSFLFAVIYSLFFGIQYGVYFDWHPIVLSIFLFTWLIYFFEKRKLKLFLLMLILFILTQENTGIALASIGFIYLFEKKNRKFALIFIFGGIGVSLMQMKIISSISPDGYQYSPKFSFNPIEILERYFNHPDKLLVWKFSLSHFSFLPLLSPGAMLGIFLDLAQYFQPEKQYPHMITPYFHHRAILAPILALGTLQVLGFISRFKRINIDLLILVMFLIMCVFQFRYHHALNKLSKPIYFNEEIWMNNNRQILKKVPNGASVASTQHLVPHMTHRNEIYLLWPRVKSDEKLCFPEKECWWLDFIGKPEYLVIDTHDGVTITQLLESRENFIEAVKNMEKANIIEIIDEVGEARIYKIIY